MSLTTAALTGDPRIQEAYGNRDRPIAFGETSSGVVRVQSALALLGFPLPKSIIPPKPPDGTFGHETLSAVRKFQKDHSLHQDGMVGQHTLDVLDLELTKLGPIPPPSPGPSPPGPPPTPPPGPPIDHDSVVKAAFHGSRFAVQMTCIRLKLLRDEISLVKKLNGPAKVAESTIMNAVWGRDIAVISKRLFVSSDALASDFRDALNKTLDLIHRQLAASSKIKDDGITGRCDPKNYNPPGTPFAATTATDPDPRVSVCTPFFTTNPNFNMLADLQRDVITHEFFHLIGLEDVSIVTNTSQALRNANTLAQIVAWTNDRTRQKNSDGNEAAVPPLPSP